MSHNQHEANMPIPTADHALPAPGQDAAHTPPPVAHHEEGPRLDLKPMGTGTVLLLAVAFAGLLGAMFAIGYFPDAHRQKEVNETARRAASAKPVVAATQPWRPKAETALSLPATAKAYQQTSIYPRANGFLKTLKVDIGDRVKEGQLLAELDIPDVEAQLLAARAGLENARSARISAKDSYDLAETTYNRYQSIYKTGAITKQELDEKQTAFLTAKSALAQADANIKSDEADIDRLTTLVGFAKIYAPFPGVVSVRNFDVGALLSNTSTTELFRVEQTDMLRVTVDVPYAYVDQVKLGSRATLQVRNFPNRDFNGKVGRTAGAVDPATRTMRVEADIPNPDGTLLPGMYGTIAFQLEGVQPPLRIPTAALVFGPEGTQVARIGSDNKISFGKIVVGRDFGQEMEVLSGMELGDRIVANPGERMANGLEVEVAEKKTVDKRDTPAAPPAKPETASASSR